jgi:hypothetical protein
MSTRQRISGNAARIIIHIRRNNSGTDKRKKNSRLPKAFLKYIFPEKFNNISCFPLDKLFRLGVGDHQYLYQ